MNHHSQILVVGRDQMLLQTHRLILGAYFDVEAAGRISEAGSIQTKHDFDLIVLCDTLTDAECQQVAEMVQAQKPKPTLLSLLGPGTKNHERHVGRNLALEGGPLQLLRECADVLGLDLNNKQQRVAAH
jgi:DNA-binding response OmpR family regulator